MNKENAVHRQHYRGGGRNRPVLEKDTGRRVAEEEGDCPEDHRRITPPDALTGRMFKGIFPDAIARVKVCSPSFHSYSHHQLGERRMGPLVWVLPQHILHPGTDM